MKTKQIVSGFRMGDCVRNRLNHTERGTVLFYDHNSLSATVKMDSGVTFIVESEMFILLDRPQSVRELIQESIEIAESMDRPWWKRLLRIS